MRKLMWFTLGFGSGCAVGAYLFPEFFWAYAIAAFAVGVSAAVCSRWVRFLQILAALSMGLSLGAAWFCGYDALALEKARALDDQISAADITVTDYSAVTDYGCTVSGEVTAAEQKYKVTVYFQDSVFCAPGDILHGSFFFRFTADGGVKDPTYHRSEGVFLLAYPQGEVTLLKADAIPQKYFPQRFRMQILQRIEMLFPGDAAAFAKALLLGDRSGIDYETNTAFKVSGISHIVAVSGLHVSILFSIAMLLFGKRRWLLFLTGIPLLALFAAVTGFSPSVVRACIMQALMLTAALLNKEYDPPTALAAAAMTMLFANPMVIISISFQLSFGCMIGIFLFSERIFHWILDEKRLGTGKGRGIVPSLKRWFARSVSVTLSAGVITTPLAAVYFGTVSLVSLITNLLVVWAVSYVFYGIIFACGISLLGMTVGRLAAWIAVYPIRFILGTAKWLSSIPMAAVYTESIYVVIWLVFTYLLLAVFQCMKRKPVLVFGGLSAICLCFCLTLSWTEPLLDPVRLTVLDVGQGQSIIVQSEGRTFLVDCGGSSSWSAADKASETLLSQGISRLDGVIVTHYDEDHAGGIAHLLSRVPADFVYLPQIADEAGIGERIRRTAGDRVVTISEDMSLSFGKANLRVFGPESYNLGNESSLCVLFQRENCDILITGDRGSLGEMLLMHRVQLPDVDVLIAGHHGSAGSTGEALLEQTKPEYVLISAGKNNRYGHPAKKLLARLAEFGCIVYRTDLYGTIVYRG